MYNFIDLEASGLGIGSYPIEVGVAMADGKTHCTLICPQQDWTHWDDQAHSLHGINRDILLLNGRSALKVALMLNEWLADETVYSDAWGNDSCWLSLLYEVAGITQRFKIDSVVSLLSQAETDGWHAAKARVLNTTQIRRHRASNDAQVLQKTLIALRANAAPIADRELAC
jgi:hypothetical protein